MTIFRTSREIPAAPESVFAAIKNPERLARWWGPDGFTNSFHTFEFKRGGRWIFTMHGPDGIDHPNESEFAEILPGARVRIKHISQPNFELSISLNACAGGTLVTWVQAFENASVAASIRRIVEPANEQNLDRLAAEVFAAAKSGA